VAHHDEQRRAQVQGGIGEARKTRLDTVDDVEATDRARQYFTGYRPSSPSIALMRDGQVVYMLERSQIENRDALAIASELTAAFEKFCTAPATA
jgi:putative YphP/YqiW family bacilliredoxin